MGRATTVVGVALSIGTAYLAQHYNNIMDLLQLVFGFVNAPLFATFLLGMFWKRATGHGAFTGLLCGTTAAALTHGLTLAEGKGGWIADLHTFPVDDGAEFLDRDLRLDNLLGRNHRGQPGHETQSRSRTAQPGLRVHGYSPRRKTCLGMSGRDCWRLLCASCS